MRLTYAYQPPESLLAPLPPPLRGNTPQCPLASAVSNFLRMGSPFTQRFDESYAGKDKQHALGQARGD